MVLLFRFSDILSLNANLQRLSSSPSRALVIKLLRRFLFGLTKVAYRLPAPSQLALALTCICTRVLTMYRCLVETKRKVTFAGPGGVVFEGHVGRSSSLSGSSTCFLYSDVSSSPPVLKDHGVCRNEEANDGCDGGEWLVAVLVWCARQGRIQPLIYQHLSPQ